jgi:hypothetical protein
MNKTLLSLFFLLIINKLEAQIFEPLYDARSEALGRTVSVLKKEATLLGNPANQVGTKSTLFTLGAQSRFLLTDVQLLHLGGGWSNEKQGFGLATQYLGNQYLRTFNIQAQYGRKLFEKLNVGIRLKGTQLNADTYGNRLNFDADLGIASQLNAKLLLGALVQNIMHFEVAAQEQNSTAVRLGVSYLPSKKVIMNLEFQQTLDLPLGINASVEYLPNNHLNFQIGVRSQTLSPSFGVGYSAQWFLIQTFASYHPQLGASSGLNLSIKM